MRVVSSCAVRRCARQFDRFAPPRCRAMSLHEEVAACVAHFRSNHPSAELEIRLGTCDDTTFTPGVDRETFAQLERDVLDDSSLTPSKLWSEVVDYYYTMPNGKSVRTRVEFNSEDMKMKTTHVHKVMEHNVLVSRGDVSRDACRIAASVEHGVDDPPHMCLVSYVRVKQRRQFECWRNGNIVWTIELSRTWSGPTREVVEYQQKNVEPKYEVECELSDTTREYMATRTDAEVANSILLKVGLLLGEDIGTTLQLNAVKKKPSRKRQSKHAVACS